jgi:16S rRNA C967 or C1407 C5-methylase (RsmB/RsmF family)/NOL1/NOP2/fmu family ribosome biogenesis protein
MENNALPKDFENRMRQSLGSEFVPFLRSLGEPSPVTVRINPKKMPHPDSQWKPVPWSEFGFYLAERPIFTLDPLLHGGGYYVQEASSMFLEQALRQHTDLKKPLRVLDLCAAPGGKSTHLASLISPDSLLVSNEVIRSRASILSENIQKWGYPNVVVTNNDPADFDRLEGFFDIIVTDAPCSGEGLFRKEPASKKEWSQENIHLCSLRQRRIVADAWPALKEDGLLIYSTCTYNEEENEHNLAWVAAQYPVKSEVMEVSESGIQTVAVDGLTGYRFFPHRINGEGFFLAVLRKNSPQSSRPIRSGNTQKKTHGFPEVRSWLLGDFRLVQQDDLLIAWPESIAPEVNAISSQLNVVIKGVAVASIKQNKLVPEHSLALSVALNKENFTRWALDYDQAIQYLRKETWAPEDASRGFVLVEYKGIPLGWVNRLGNRFNNLYPSNWRIRMNPGRHDLQAED